MLCIECKAREVDAWGTDLCKVCRKTDVAEVSIAVRKLTNRQFELLTFIADYIRNYLSTPTYRECAEALGIKQSSRGALFHHLNSLETKGYVVRMTGRQDNTIFMTPKARREFGLEFHNHDTSNIAPGPWQEAPVLKMYVRSSPPDRTYS